MPQKRFSWAASGDINAFFGLMLDNVADLLLAVGLLGAVFEFPTDFALTHMVPGTALGVLVGDLCFFVMALRLARQTGRATVTAMPLGLDTPSTLGMVFFVLGPAYQAGLTEGLSVAESATRTWHIGICCIFVSGLFKFACAFVSGWVRRVVPRAGLLGSLAAIALVLISFLPLMEVLHVPLVGLLSLIVILLTLVARASLRIPGTLAALLVGCAAYYGVQWLGEQGVTLFGTIHGAQPVATPFFPTEWLSALSFPWLSAMPLTYQYLPVVIPFALATVVGGIDCTESAAAAGDEYPTGQVIGVEAAATLLASLCGGVIQSTPYIGHPAYKAMGGRAAYTLATALFVGAAGLSGYFGLLYAWIPRATVFPILVFIGLEITAQSFQATPKRHYAAVALACIPALAALGLIFVDKLLGDPAIRNAGLGEWSLQAPLRGELMVLRTLANGFIVTSLLWASMLAAMIDGRMFRAAGFLAVGAVCTLFGVIHSPLPGAPMFWPLELDGGVRLAGPLVAGAPTADLMRGLFWGYVAAAVLLVGCAWAGVRPAPGEHDGHDGHDGHEHRSDPPQ